MSNTNTPNLDLLILRTNPGWGAYRILDANFALLDALFGEATLEYAAAITAFLSATTEDVTLTGDPTISLTPNPIPGLEYKLWIVQDATGNRTVTWSGTITWAGGAPPVLSTVAGKKNLIRCQYINSTLGWHCEMDANVY